MVQIGSERSQIAELGPGVPVPDFWRRWGYSPQDVQREEEELPGRSIDQTVEVELGNFEVLFQPEHLKLQFFLSGERETWALPAATAPAIFIKLSASFSLVGPIPVPV